MLSADYTKFIRESVVEFVDTAKNAVLHDYAMRFVMGCIALRLVVYLLHWGVGVVAMDRLLHHLADFVDILNAGKNDESSEDSEESSDPDASRALMRSMAMAFDAKAWAISRRVPVEYFDTLRCIRRYFVHYLFDEYSFTLHPDSEHLEERVGDMSLYRPFHLDTPNGLTFMEHYNVYCTVCAYAYSTDGTRKKSVTTNSTRTKEALKRQMKSDLGGREPHETFVASALEALSVIQCPRR
jgi:hypothetical protein